MDESNTKKIARDVENIKRTLINMDKTLALQHASLVDHIKRTELLEKKLEPVEKHVEQVRGMSKLTMGIIALLGVVAAFLTLKS